MAGAGFRTFAAGEVLTASNVNTYLMEQSIMNFAGTAARSSAISSPSEGMFAYLQDTNTLTFYNGSAWVNAGSAIAGTALSSGTATSGQVLTANGSGAVTFSTPSSGLTLINTTSFSGVASQSINDVFSATYNNYKIFTSVESSTTGQECRMRMRVSGADNTNNNYQWAGWFIPFNGTATVGGENTNPVGQSWFNVADIENNGKSHSDITLFSPFATEKTGCITHQIFRQGTTNGYAETHCGGMDVTTSYTGLTIYASSGTLTGTISIYGVNK